jgi:hypothetical protein
MRLDFFILAESAEFLPDGRFFVFGGGFEGIRAAAYPAVIPSFVLAVRLIAASDECDGTHTLRISATGPDGQPIMPDLRLEFGPLPRSHQEGRATKFGAAARVTGLPIPQAGEYVFSLFVDEKELEHRIFHADMIPANEENQP